MPLSAGEADQLTELLRKAAMPPVPNEFQLVSQTVL